MATQRYISTSFWDDEWIQTLDPSEKLLYLYFMTNPLTNIAGVYKITRRRISFDTGFNDDTIGHILTKFEKAKKAFVIGEYIALPSWPHHQKWQEAPKIKQGIEIILCSLPRSILDQLSKIGYQYPLDTISIGYTYPSSYSDLDSDIDIDSDKDTDTDIRADKPPRQTFIKPTIEEIKAYCLERKNAVDPGRFLDFYDSKGWLIGKNKMKDWRAAVRTWERGDKRQGNGPRVLSRTASLDMEG